MFWVDLTLEKSYFPQIAILPKNMMFYGSQNQSFALMSPKLNFKMYDGTLDYTKQKMEMLSSKCNFSGPFVVGCLISL